MVNLTIDRVEVSVPAGTLIVEAARSVGINIPVFCFHPRLDPVGMCRMCLVEIGRPVMDRATNQPVLEEDGSPKIQFGPKLETACTTPVSEGMVVVCDSQKVVDARREILEFLLTSHPLDCPICDKGGECSLQELTRAYGPAESRFHLDEKKRLGKQIPLGELIYLDQERCIHCGRCVRFQHEVVDDPVLAFTQRGRAMQIVTHSQPGFDSIFSGNTTDLCPVGALTTADFRFRARPWELKAAASICSHCAVGCNITFNVRREDRAGGRWVIKRVMPRQNEAVNGLWICDKGRFGYHYTESEQRITRPLVRKANRLEEATWEEALQAASGGLKKFRKKTAVLAGGRLSNEDLFNLARLADATGGKKLLHSHLAGGELVSQVGPGQGTNLGELGSGCMILVVACDLHQEAPLWWLRVKQAAARGATLVTVGPRPTRMDKYARHVIRTGWGGEAQALMTFLPGARPGRNSTREALEDFRAAENVLVILGGDCLGLEGSQALAATCANLLVQTGHFGKKNNGMMVAWPNGNTQGAFEMGFLPEADLAGTLSGVDALIVAAADPVGDDPAMAEALRKVHFLVVQELFLTDTARLADVVLPAQPFTEREGTVTSGDRRVQRFYPALPPTKGCEPDHALAAMLAAGLDLEPELEKGSPLQVFRQMAAEAPAFEGLTYEKLAETGNQWPLISREDLFYGGTAYENLQGLGVQLAPAAQLALPLNLPGLPEPVSMPKATPGQVILLPVGALLDRGTTLLPSAVLHERLQSPVIRMHPATAGALKLNNGDMLEVPLAGRTWQARLQLDDQVPEGAALMPRGTGLPITSPQAVALHPLQPAKAGG